MVKQMSSNSETALADRLKREAEATRPEFSEALHERICRAILSADHVAQSGPRPGLPREASTSGRLPTYTAVAVAVALSLTLIVWQAVHQPGPTFTPTLIVKPTMPAPNPEPGPPIEPPEYPLESLHALVDFANDVPGRVDATVDSTLLGGQLAQLDHDVRLAASLLTGPLPLEMLASAGRM